MPEPINLSETAVAWGQWMMARGSLTFALEDEVRAALDTDSAFLDPDGRLAVDACQRLADAIARFARELAGRPPPAGLAALGDALLSYLGWRRQVAEQQAQALTTGGWDAALALLARDDGRGRALHDAFLGQLALLNGEGRSA